MRAIQRGEKDRERNGERMSECRRGREYVVCVIA